MLFTTFFTCVALGSTTGWAQYTLQQDFFQGGNFFDNFDFFTGVDPTAGFVEYVDQPTAQSGGMISGSDSIYMGVNYRDVTATGRQSVRLTSKQIYQSGLVVLDLAHMPGGICGTWPAFWMVGPDWPNNGEIDIIEGVNDQTANQMTLHTGSTCDIGPSSMLGKVLETTCDVSNGDNTGCGISADSAASYGTGFNAAGGGTYATEWTSSAISIYFFPRGREPADLNSGSPNPSTWGPPMAQFGGGCDIGSNFRSQQIVFDTTFCGVWAGDAWGSSGCASMAPSCNTYVGQNPSAFRNAFWTINGLKVYQGGAAGGNTTTGPIPSGRPSGRPSAAPSGFVSSRVGARPSGGPAPAPSGAPHRGPVGRPSGAPAPAPSGAPIPSGAPPQPSGFAPSPSGAPAPAPSGAPAPAPSGAPAPSSPPGGGGHGHWHHHGGWHGGWNGPPQDDLVEAATASVQQNLPRETDAAGGNGSADIRSRHLRHLRHHMDAHGARRL